jgi:hypothetical protein
MEQSHRENVLAFLERRARSLMEHARWREQNTAARSLSREDYEAYIDQCMASIDGNPEDWLNRKPFMENLRAIIGRYGALEPDKLELEA